VVCQVKQSQHESTESQLIVLAEKNVPIMDITAVICKEAYKIYLRQPRKFELLTPLVPLKIHLKIFSHPFFVENTVFSIPHLGS